MYPEHLTKPMEAELTSKGFQALKTADEVTEVVAQSEGTVLKNLSDRYKLICNKSIEVIKTDISFTVKVPLLYE